MKNNNITAALLMTAIIMSSIACTDNTKAINEALRLGMVTGEKVGYRNGFNVGRDSGYIEGLEQGKAISQERAYYSGFQDGKDQGHQEGYARGVPDGYENGFFRGHLQGCEESREKFHKSEIYRQSIIRCIVQYVLCLIVIIGCCCLVYNNFPKLFR